MIDPAKLAALLALSVAGARPAVCEYLRVDWSSSTTNYYGAAAWHEVPPFYAIGHTIEPRLMPSSIRDPFHGLEINPDLRTDSVKVVFEDIDKVITGKFQTFSSGVKCEFFLYYPDVDLTVPIWSGQLQAPDVFGWKTVSATATNGFRSRELTIGSRRRTKECTASVFGGRLPDLDAVRSSLCHYEKHLPGGTVGNFKTGIIPYLDCDKLLPSCIARLGRDGFFFGGFNTDAAGMITDYNNNFLAQSKGNTSALKEPIRVIFGKKVVKSNLTMLWRREQTYYAAIYEIGEGLIKSINNFRVNEKLIGGQHLNVQLGARAQARTQYAANVSNFSGTAHVFARSGPFTAAQVTAMKPADITTDCLVEGFAEVCVYTVASPATKTRIYSTNRIWCLLELYKNQKFGFGYAESRFAIADWMTEATFSENTVSFTATFPDGETTQYISPRSSLNVIMEGRAAGEQIEDMCRSGGISIPFEHEGKFTLRSFRKATAGELTAAKVFSDTGESRNIIWDGGQPMIELSQTPDNKIVNEIEVRFEDAASGDTERPLIVDDPNQKLKAGRQLGPDYSLSVPKKFTAFGVNNLAESVRLAYRLLKYGEFDNGGTDNNLRAKLTVPFEHALGVTRYDIIKLDTALMSGFTIGYGANAETPQYFRVLSLKKVSQNRCEITAQAYNHTSYSAFEVVSVVVPGSGVITVRNGGTTELNTLWDYAGQVNAKPCYSASDGRAAIYWTGTQWNMELDSVQYYKSLSAVDFPYQATWIVGTAGLAPAPEVLEGIVFETITEERSITAATFNSTTGVLSVTLD